MKTALATLAAVVLLSNCRTSIIPARAKAQTDDYVKKGQCNVQEFPAATDVPAGAKPLGWISVDSTGDDQATMELLRKKICEKGGDALSQAAWVKAPGQESPELKANAWELP